MPDLISRERVVVAAKTIEMIPDDERGTMIHDLKVTDLQSGLIISFKHRKLEWERFVLT